MPKAYGELPGSASEANESQDVIKGFRTKNLLIGPNVLRRASDIKLPTFQGLGEQGSPRGSLAGLSGSPPSKRQPSLAGNHL